MTYNLKSPTSIQSAPDVNNLDEWFKREVSLLRSPVEETILLQIVANIQEWVKFPQEAKLLMPETDRKKKYHSFPEEIKLIAKAQKIPLDTRGNGPAKASYLLCGGIRPLRKGTYNGWSIHHLYSGKFPHPFSDSTIHAVKLGDHFSHSAGLVAIHPIADAMADEYPCFTWYLRALAFQKFKYDPDMVFSTKLAILPKKEPQAMSNNSIYESTRLTFKRDVIENLKPFESFKIKCPDGTFVMTKEQFYDVFSNVAKSNSYRKGNYSYETTPQKAFQFLEKKAA